MKYDDKYRVKSLNWITNKEIGSINCTAFIYSKKELMGGYYGSLIPIKKNYCTQAHLICKNCLIYKAVVKHMITMEL